jgi:hypothetical protein
MTTPDDQPHPPVPPVPAPASEAPAASPYAAPASDPYASDPYAKTTATPPAPPAAYAPSYTSAYGAPTGPTEPRGLSIASMVTGIAGILFAFLPSAIAAVILGHLAQRRQPAGRPFWLTGLITGYIGILFGIIITIVVIALIVFAYNAPSDYGQYDYDFSNASGWTR